MEPTPFAESLRVRRRSLGLSQRELARRAGLSLRAVRNIEQGRVRRPRPGSVRALTEALRLSDVEAGGPVLWVGALGPLAVRRSGRPVDVPGVGVRRLLGLLAIQPGRLIPADEVVDVLWGAGPPRAWPQSLHHYVWKLRRLLEPGRPQRTPSRTLVRERGGYRLELADDQLDVRHFDRLAARAGTAADALPVWAEALACWRGPVLADLGAALRQHPAAVALAGRRVTATLAYADLAIARGDCAPAVPVLRGAAAAEPLHEGVHARLMLALAGCGEQAAALAVFAGLRGRLADELGVGPGAELARAHVQVLRGEVPPGGSAVPVPWVPPAQLPADVAFTGRTDLLARLDTLLDTRPAAVVVTALGGTAGVGKSALATHWAHRVAPRFGDGQLYANLRGFDPTGAPLDPAEALGAFLLALGVPPERVPSSVGPAAALYRSVLATRSVLVLLDNARDAAQVRPLLPGSPGCLALVTSRDRLSGLVAVDGAHPLLVEPMPPAEARALLAARLGTDRTAAEPAAVEEIVTRCAGLPLALAIVAARAAAQPRFPLATFAAELHGSVLDGFGGADPATDVRAVFSWSYAALSAAAARLFRQLSLQPGLDIGVPAAASLAGLPRRRVRQLLGELMDAHLACEHVPGRYAFHDLLRAYSAERAGEVDPPADRDAARRRVLDHYLHSAHAAGILLPGPLAEPPADPPAPAVPGVTPERFATEDQARAWLAAEHHVLRAAAAHHPDAGRLSRILERAGHRTG